MIANIAKRRYKIAYIAYCFIIAINVQITLKFSNNAIHAIQITNKDKEHYYPNLTNSLTTFMPNAFTEKRIL